MLGILITQCAPVPKGAIFMFDGSPPAGWQVLTDFNGRFPLGDSIGGILGGDSMHMHTVSGRTDTVLGWGTSGTFLGMQGHTHSYNFTTDQQNHLPPYRTFIFAKALMNMEYLPRNAIIISYDSPYSTDFYDLTDSMLGYFPRGNSIAGYTGGYTKHSHWDISGYTDSMIVIGDTLPCSAPGISRSSRHSFHTHQVFIHLDSAYHIPPYRTVRFWKVVSDSVRIDSCKVIYMFDTLPSCSYLTLDWNFIGLFPRADTATALMGGQRTHTHNYELTTDEVSGDILADVDLSGTGANCIPEPHNHGFYLSRVSSEASNMPPYRTVIFSVCSGYFKVSERQLKFSPNEYKIYNVSGKVIYLGKGTPTLKNLPRGVYFVVSYGDKGRRVIKRIIR